MHCVCLFIKDRQTFSLHLNREGIHRTTNKLKSCRKCTKNRKDRWAFRNQPLQQVTAQPPREELTETLILRCTKNLDRISCDANMMRLEVGRKAADGKNRQEPGRSMQCHLHLGRTCGPAPGRLAQGGRPRRPSTSQPAASGPSSPAGLHLPLPHEGRFLFTVTPGKVHKHEGISQAHNINEI